MPAGRMLISIVVPTLDRRELLAHALDSVSAQRDPDVQVIVVDGGSTDGTLEMLAQRGDATVIDDRRRGLYDAIDLGLEHASGSVFMLLNSDDLLVPGALAAIRDGFARAPHADAVSGRVELFDDTGGAVTAIRDERDIALDAHAALIGASIINGRAFRLGVISRIGGFGARYATVADRAFLARFVAARMVNETVQATIYRYRRHPGSLTFSGNAGKAEAFRAELLGFARDVAGSSTAGSDLHAKAVALEGRCLAASIYGLVKARDPAGGLRKALVRGPNASTHPLVALVRAAYDRLATRDRR
jgi:glycosyltransferase involved in cell wall biosynthesis